MYAQLLILQLREWKYKTFNMQTGHALTIINHSLIPVTDGISGEFSMDHNSNHG